MNNELIERIDAVLESWQGVTVLPDDIYVLQDCKAALTQQQEAEPVAWVDEAGRVVRVSEDGSGDGGWVSGNDRAIPDSWTPLRPPKPAAQPQGARAEASPAVAAIQYAITTDDPAAFLSLWTEGDFDAIRREWEGVPEGVFIGANPSMSVIDKGDAWAQPQVPEGMRLVDDIAVLAIRDGNIFHTEVAELIRAPKGEALYLYASDTRAMLSAAKEEGR